jgi:hypothetical protein
MDRLPGVGLRCVPARFVQLGKAKQLTAGLGTQHLAVHLGSRVQLREPTQAVQQPAQNGCSQFGPCPARIIEPIIELVIAEHRRNGRMRRAERLNDGGRQFFELG